MSVLKAILKSAKKLFSKKGVLGFLSAVVLGFLYALINAIASKISFWKSLLDLFVKLGKLLINLKIPLYVLLGLGLLYFLFMKLKKKRISKEHIWALGMTAVVKSEISEEQLLKEYVKEFPGTLLIELRFIINDLERYDLIYNSSTLEGEKFYQITSEGLEYIRKWAKRKKMSVISS